MDDSKMLPFSKLHEDAVIGACLYEPTVISELITIVKPEHFFSRNLAYIFQTILDMHSKDETIDALMVWRKIKNNSKGITSDYLLDLEENIPTVEKIGVYGKLVAEDYYKRTAMHHANNLHEAMRESENVQATISEHIRTLEGISTQGISDPVTDVRDTLRETIEYLDQKAQGKIEEDALPTGLTDLDNLLNGGLRRRHFDILAARPAMGKTSLAVQILLNNAIKFGNNCLFYSIEMPKRLIEMKMLSIVGPIPYRFLDKPNHHLNWDKVIDSASKINGAKGRILIDDQTKELNQMLSLTRKYVRNNNIKFVVIDYLQLMTIPGKYGTRDTEIGHAVNELAYLAKILDINILCLSQLNRGVESRESKVPMLSDLRESGNIEQSAWRVLAIHRDEYYNPETEDQGIADIHVLKGKISNVGNVKVHYDKECTRFDNLEWQRGNY